MQSILPSLCHKRRTIESRRAFGSYNAFSFRMISMPFCQSLRGCWWLGVKARVFPLPVAAIPASHASARLSSLHSRSLSCVLAYDILPSQAQGPSVGLTRSVNYVHSSRTSSNFGHTILQTIFSMHLDLGRRRKASVPSSGLQSSVWG